MTFVTSLFAQVSDAGTVTPDAADQGLTKYPVDLYNLGGGFELTNSIVSEIIVTLIIVGVIQFGMRSPKLVPSGLQNFIEWIVEAMQNFLELLMGRATTQRGFWYFGGLIVFIMLGNLLALVPGVGTIGWGHEVNGHFEVTKPFLRGMNANDNLTAAYSAIFFVMFFYWCIRAAGVGGSLFHIFGPKVRFKNVAADWTFILIFFLVGWVEVITILFIRPIAFTFRLYGNIFGGEYLLDSMYKMSPNFAFLILTPFYFYELLVAVVQAFVFFVLTAAFTGLITNDTSHGSHDEKDGAH